MNNYIRADLHRIFRRVPRHILLVAVFAILAYIGVKVFTDYTIYEICDLFSKHSSKIFFVFGLIEYAFVYGDDFRARTMQIAIGTGVSRRHVVLAKWLEAMFLCLLDLLCVFVIIIGICAVNGIAFTGDAALDLVIMFFFDLIKIGGAYAFTQIFIFLKQGTGLGMLIFISMYLGIINIIATIVTDSNLLKSFHLEKYMFTAMLNLSRSRLLVGSLSPALLGIVVYLVFFYAVTCLIFRKRELEF